MRKVCDILFFPYYERIKKFVLTGKIDTKISGHTLFLFEFLIIGNELNDINLLTHKKIYATTGEKFNYVNTIFKLIELVEEGYCPTDKNTQSEISLDEILIKFIENLSHISFSDIDFLFLIRENSELKVLENSNEFIKYVNEHCKEKNIEKFIRNNILCIVLPGKNFMDSELWARLRRIKINDYDDIDNFFLNLAGLNANTYLKDFHRQYLNFLNKMSLSIKEILKISILSEKKLNKDYILSVQEGMAFMLKYYVFISDIINSLSSKRDKEKNQKEILINIFILLLLLISLNFLLYIKSLYEENKMNILEMRKEESEQINFLEKKAVKKFLEGDKEEEAELLELFARHLPVCILEKAQEKGILKFSKDWRKVFFILYTYYLISPEADLKRGSDFYHFAKSYQEFLKNNELERAIQIFLSGKWYKEMKGYFKEEFKEAKEYGDLRKAKNDLLKMLNKVFSKLEQTIKEIDVDSCLERFKELKDKISTSHISADRIDFLFESLKSRLIERIKEASRE
ncbi:hypothetical protein [Aquifex sp.]